MPSWGLIASKDLRVLWRDRVALFWVVVFPLVFALFFGSVVKPDDGSGTETISVVVVETAAAAGSPASLAAERMVAFLKDASLRVTRASEAAARDAVRRGEAVAFVRAVGEEDASILLGVDPSRRSETALLTSLLGAAPGSPGAARPRPGVETEQVVRASGASKTGFQIVFPAMILWGLLGCAATFAISMVAERASGTLLRLRAAPVTRASILGGKAVACAVACMADVLLLTVVGWLLGVHIGDPGKYGAAVGAAVVCFAGLTMALSVLGRSEQAVAGAGWATLILMAMLGGAMVPLSLFPQWMLDLSDLSPVKWGILALEGATWRDFGWDELARPLGVLLATGALGFVSGVGVLVASREV